MFLVLWLSYQNIEPEEGIVGIPDWWLVGQKYSRFETCN